MSTTQFYKFHNPAPLTTDGLLIVDADKNIVARVESAGPCNHLTESPETHALAKVMAAGPELLAALRTAVVAMHTGNCKKAIAEADAAIYKAIGEPASPV